MKRYLTYRLCLASAALCAACSDMLDSYEPLPPPLPPYHESLTVRINDDAPYCYYEQVRVGITAENIALLRLSDGVTTGPETAPPADPVDWTIPYQTGIHTITGLYTGVRGGTGSAADTIHFLDRITLESGEAFERCSRALDLSADASVAAVSARGEGGGRVQISRRGADRWTHTLLALPAPYDATQGEALALSADGAELLVGCPAADGGRGAVYLYRWDGAVWNSAQTLSGDAVGDGLGGVLALAANQQTLLCAAPGIPDVWSGYLRRYTRSGSSWIAGARFNATAVDGDDATRRFGASVAVSGAVLVAGDPEYRRTDAGVHRYTGYAVVFADRGAGFERMELREQDGTMTLAVLASAAEFGYAVALSADETMVAIGAPGAGGGVVYVYGWNSTAFVRLRTLSAPSGASGTQYRFGEALRFAGSRLFVGAPAYSPAGLPAGCGAVVIYDAATGTLLGRYTTPDAMSGDRFGAGLAVSADGATALIGSTLDDNEKGTDAGAAYLVREIIP
jgi:hypothetical protein